MHSRQRIAEFPRGDVQFQTFIAYGRESRGGVRILPCSAFHSASFLPFHTAHHCQVASTTTFDSPTALYKTHILEPSQCTRRNYAIWRVKGVSLYIADLTFPHTLSLLGALALASHPHVRAGNARSPRDSPSANPGSRTGECRAPSAAFPCSSSSSCACSAPPRRCCCRPYRYRCPCRMRSRAPACP